MKLWSKAGRTRRCCEGNGLRLGLASIRQTSLRFRFFSIVAEVKTREVSSCTKKSQSLQEANSSDERTEVTPKIGVYELLDQLRECCIARDLTRGRSIHASATQSGEVSNLYVANCLISMYAKCGSMVDAKKVFETMQHRDVVTWNSLLSGYADHGEGELVLEFFEDLLATNACTPNGRTYMAALKACSNMAVREEGKKTEGQFLKERALEKGRDIHLQAVASSCSSDIFLATSVVDMYASCGSLDEAYINFVRMPRYNIVSWSALMMGCAENGEPELALELFLRLKQTRRIPNSRAFVAALKACAKVALKEEGVAVDGRMIKRRGLRKGTAIHNQATELGLDTNFFVSSALLLMYVKCGSSCDAREVFDKMPRHDLVSWTTMLLGYAENGEEELALEFFATVPVDGCEPDAVACVAAIKACTKLAAREDSSIVDGRLIKVASLERASDVRSRVMKSRHQADMSVAIALVDMYSRCGSVEDARRAFDCVLVKEVALWNSLMLCYVDNGEARLALEAFVFLRSESIAPNPLTFVAATKACASLAAAETEKAKVKSNGKVVKTEKESLERGMIVHSRAVGYGCDRQPLVASALMDLYGECGSLVDARIVFDKSISWNSVMWNGLMFCCVENGEAGLALELFSAMQNHGLAPDSVSYISAFKACASLSTEAKAIAGCGKRQVETFLRRGRELHFGAANFGLHWDIFLGNSLVDMYAKCGSMPEAQRVFNTVPLHNVVSWTSLILGYSDNQQHDLALDAFWKMTGECGCQPDALLYIAVLKACGTSAALETVKFLHGEISRYDHLQDSPALVASLVDAYGKCGDVTYAHHLFDTLQRLDAVTWTALLSAYSRRADGRRIVELFQTMEDDEISPGSVTFVSVLSACSHAGLVERGRSYFEAMRSKYGIVPELEHYVCMVDMLGRANQLEMAVEMVARMKEEVKPNDVVWRTVLAACYKCQNVEVGKAAFEAMLEKDNDSAAYVLVSNIYKKGDRVIEEGLYTSLSASKGGGTSQGLPQAQGTGP